MGTVHSVCETDVCQVCQGLGKLEFAKSQTSKPGCVHEIIITIVEEHRLCKREETVFKI